MSDTSLKIYSDHLEYQLSDKGHFTTEALYDTAGIASLSPITIYGIFDSITFPNNVKDDSENIGQNAKAIFIVKNAPDEFDPYKDYKIQIVKNGKTYKINNISLDEEGAQVLWLV